MRQKFSDFIARTGLIPLALLLVLAAGILHFQRGPAHHPPPPPPPPHEPPARVIRIDGDLVQLENPFGWQKTVRLDDRTRFRRWRDEARRSDLQVGSVVSVQDVQQNDGVTLALLVDFMPSHPPRERLEPDFSQP